MANKTMPTHHTALLSNISHMPLTTRARYVTQICLRMSAYACRPRFCLTVSGFSLLIDLVDLPIKNEIWQRQCERLISSRFFCICFKFMILLHDENSCTVVVVIILSTMVLFHVSCILLKEWLPRALSAVPTVLGDIEKTTKDAIRPVIDYGFINTCSSWEHVIRLTWNITVANTLQRNSC